MKFLLKLVREALGRIIIAIDFLTRPQPLKRSKPEQTRINSQLAGLALYQFYACPFCIKTRRALRRLNLPMQLRDISEGSPHRQELIEQGGKLQAPCLRLEQDGQVRWLYDSSAIISYLEQRFGVIPGTVSGKEAASQG